MDRMNIVLGVSMERTAVRLVLIEGEDADGVTVEEANFPVAAVGDEAEDSATSEAPSQTIAAIVGTGEGAAESGYRLTSTGVTWTDPADVGALRNALAVHDVGSVMLVSPLLAAAALAQTVGLSIDYEHIAMLFVEAGSATLAVVDVADGSIVDLHRRQLVGARGAVAAELATMVAGLDAPGSRADGVFLVGCGVDIVAFKSALEAATSLVVSVPEEPDLALARGAALASANAPLFTSSTAGLAYALDPGTGEVNPRALSPGYLDVCANADRGQGVLAYSALDDADDGEESVRRRRPLVLTGSAMAGAAALATGLLVVSSDVRPMAAQQPSPPAIPESIVTPLPQAPPATVPAQAPSTPPQVKPTAPSPVPAAPAAEVAAPPAPPPVVQPPRTVANMAPATPRWVPTRKAPVPAPVQQAPQPSPPAAVPAPPPPPTPPPQPTPTMTVYLHLPFVTIPIPINPPPPPPPPEPLPAEPALVPLP